MPKKKSWTSGMVNKPGYWGGNTRSVLKRKREFEAYKKAHPEGMKKPDVAGSKPKPKPKPKTAAQIRSEKAAALRGRLAPDFLKPLSEALRKKED